MPGRWQNETIASPKTAKPLHRKCTPQPAKQENKKPDGGKTDGRMRPNGYSLTTKNSVTGRQKDIQKPLSWRGKAAYGDAIGHLLLSKRPPFTKLQAALRCTKRHKAHANSWHSAVCPCTLHTALFAPKHPDFSNNAVWKRQGKSMCKQKPRSGWQVCIINLALIRHKINAS